MRKSGFCNIFPSMYLIKSIKFTQSGRQIASLLTSQITKFGFSTQNQSTLSTFFFKTKTNFSSFGPNSQKKMALFSQKATNKQIWLFELLRVLYIFLTMDGLSKCPPPHPPPEKSDLLVYFTHWRL